MSQTSNLTMVEPAPRRLERLLRGGLDHSGPTGSGVPSHPGAFVCPLLDLRACYPGPLARGPPPLRASPTAAPDIVRSERASAGYATCTLLGHLHCASKEPEAPDYATLSVLHEGDRVHLTLRQLLRPQWPPLKHPRRLTARHPSTACQVVLPVLTLTKLSLLSLPGPLLRCLGTQGTGWTALRSSFPSVQAQLLTANPPRAARAGPPARWTGVGPPLLLSFPLQGYEEDLLRCLLALVPGLSASTQHHRGACELRCKAVKARADPFE